MHPWLLIAYILIVRLELFILTLHIITGVHKILQSDVIFQGFFELMDDILL